MTTDHPTPAPMDGERVEELERLGTVEAIEKTWAEMMEWVDGRMSYTNTYAHLQRPDIVATMDAQEVVKRSAVIQALCALQRTETL